MNSKSISNQPKHRRLRRAIGWLLLLTALAIPTWLLMNTTKGVVAPYVPYHRPISFLEEYEGEIKASEFQGIGGGVAYWHHTRYWVEKVVDVDYDYLYRSQISIGYQVPYGTRQTWPGPNTAMARVKRFLGKIHWTPKFRIWHANGGWSWDILIPFWIPLLTLGVPAIRLIWTTRYRPGFCRKCGYDLTGNVSGRCSECGVEFDSEKIASVNDVKSS